MSRIKYSYTQPKERRKHYLEGQDIEVLLNRLPPGLWSRLRGPFQRPGEREPNLGLRESRTSGDYHFAPPPNVSLSRCLTRRSPRLFGAIRGYQWPERAVRRFMLYDVFLHELGHLQVVDAKADTVRRQFASETKAQEFADEWCARLWAEPFAHPDPIHNPASPVELEILQYELQPHGNRESVVVG